MLCLIFASSPMFQEEIKTTIVNRLTMRQLKTALEKVFIFLIKYLIFLQISELLSIKQPKNSF